MAFGNGYNQNTYMGCIPGNNFCAGFALAAVINEEVVEEAQVYSPLNIYGALQKHQIDVIKQLPNKNDYYNFLCANLTNGTAMTLPSSICNFCYESYGYTTFVSYLKSLSSVFDSIFESELGLIANKREYNTNVDLINNLNSINPYTYHLLLINYCHWVALKKIGSSYLLYDPGTGKEASVDIQYLHRQNISIIISFTNFYEPVEP